MNTFDSVLFSFVFLHVALGAAVWARCPRSRSHRWYAILSVSVGVWTGLSLASSFIEVAQTPIMVTLCFAAIALYRVSKNIPLHRRGDSSFIRDGDVLLSVSWLLASLVFSDPTGGDMWMFWAGVLVLVVASMVQWVYYQEQFEENEVFAQGILRRWLPFVGLGILMGGVSYETGMWVHLNDMALVCAGVGSLGMAGTLFSRESFMSRPELERDHAYENFTEGVLRIASDGTVVYANAAAYAILGRTRGEAVDFPRFDALIHPPCESLEAHKKAIRGESAEMEGSVLDENGKWVSVEYSLSSSGLGFSEGTLCAIRRASELRVTLQKLQETSMELEKKAFVDPLTGGNNRRFLDQELNRRVIEALRHQTPLSVVMFDLDHFKQVNDRLGHIEGDRVLRAVVKVCSAGLRSADSLSRYGGDEFVLVLPNTGKRASAFVSERLLHKISDLSENLSLKVSGSFGVVTYEAPYPLIQPEELIQAADDALLQAKRSGRNLVQIGELSAPDGAQRCSTEEILLH